MLLQAVLGRVLLADVPYCLSRVFACGCCAFWLRKPPDAGKATRHPHSTALKPRPMEGHCSNSASILRTTCGCVLAVSLMLEHRKQTSQSERVLQNLHRRSLSCASACDCAALSCANRVGFIVCLSIRAFDHERFAAILASVFIAASFKTRFAGSFRIAMLATLVFVSLDGAFKLAVFEIRYLHCVPFVLPLHYSSGCLVSSVNVR